MDWIPGGQLIPGAHGHDKQNTDEREISYIGMMLADVIKQIGLRGNSNPVLEFRNEFPYLRICAWSSTLLL